MIVELSDDTTIDVDKISFFNKPTGIVMIDGCFCSLTEQEMEVVSKAFKYRYKIGRYDKNLKKIDPKGE